MPNVLVTIDAGEEPDVRNYELSMDFTLGDLKGLVEADTGLVASRQSLFLNGEILRDNSQTLQAAGIKDQDMLYVNQDRPQPQQQQQPSSSLSPGQAANLGTAEAVQQIEGLRQQLLARINSAPQDLSQLQRQAPELMNAIHDPARFRNVFWEQQGLNAQRRQAMASELESLNNDMTEEGQAKIYEAIRQARIAEEAEKAMEEHPELFGRVTMLYVKVEVNGHAVKAFVDSGAQATIMSPSCAEACNVTKSIDTRFAGIARGVGTAKILGRVHSATLTIGDFKDYQLPCAFTVMEGKDVDMLLGLDMLKRYQACIDLQKNRLVLGGGSISVPFLDESDIPKSFEERLENEPTVPGPGGSAIGAESGALKPPAQASSSKAATNFSGQGRTLGAASSSQPPAQAAASQVPAARSPIPPRPSAPTPGTAQFPESDITILMGLGATRDQAIQALRACNGNVEYAAGIIFGE